MLGKLIKYDFKSIGRILLPLYAAVIILSIINKFFGLPSLVNADSEVGIIKILLMVTYTVIMIGSFIATFVIIIQRYKGNLFSKEGYLMHTLPVKPWHLILSKLICAFIWCLLSVLCALSSIFILVYEEGFFAEMYSYLSLIFKELYSYTGGYSTIFSLSCIFVVIFGTLSIILQVYSAISIGSLFNKYKFFAEFAAFIIMDAFEQYVFYKASSISMPPSISISVNNIADIEKISLPMLEYANNTLLATSAILALFSVIYFLINNYIISKKLNLE